MAGRRLLDMRLWVCHPPGMREGMTLRCAAEVIDVWITIVLFFFLYCMIIPTGFE